MQLNGDWKKQRAELDEDYDAKQTTADLFCYHSQAMREPNGFGSPTFPQQRRQSPLAARLAAPRGESTIYLSILSEAKKQTNRTRWATSVSSHAVPASGVLCRDPVHGRNRMAYLASLVYRPTQNNPENDHS